MENKGKRENSQDELDRFKKDINIVDYALNNGYSIDKEKDSKNYRALRKENDVVIVSQLKSGHSWYFNQHDSEDKGTIVDFVKTRNNVDLGQARKILRDYSNTTEYSSTKEYPASATYVPIKKIQQPEAERNEIMAEFLKLDKKLTDRTYLKSRGISDETLDNPAFDGKIFNNKVTDKSGEKTYTNTAFPIYDRNGMISVELKNEKFKGVLENTPAGQGLWISSNTEGDKNKKLDKLVISESGIDSLSYHQLKHKKGENSMYVATIGNVTEAKTELIQQIIDKRKPEQVIAAVDNDNAGSRYRINFLSNLQPPRELKEVDGQKVPVDREKNIEFKAVPTGQYTSKIDLVVKHEDIIQRDKALKEIKEKLWDINNGHTGEKLFNNTLDNQSLGNRKIDEIAVNNIKKEVEKAASDKSLITGDEDLKWSISKSTDKETHLRIDLKNNALPTAEDFLKSLKQEYDKKMGLEKEFIKIDKPIEKDFNDDLRGSKNINYDRSQGQDKSEVKSKLNELEEKVLTNKVFSDEIGIKGKKIESIENAQEVKNTGYRVQSLQETVKSNNNQINTLSENSKNLVETKLVQEVKVGAEKKGEETKVVPQREYFKMLDDLEISYKKDGKLEEMKDKVNYYRHFPHLTDEEVDKYVSIKDKIEKDKGPERNIDNSKKQFEIE